MPGGPEHLLQVLCHPVCPFSRVRTRRNRYFHRHICRRKQVDVGAAQQCVCAMMREISGRHSIVQGGEWKDTCRMTTPRTSGVGELLRQYRVAAGLTQEELAERAQVSVRAIGSLERGARRTPHKDTLRLLAEALNLNEEDQALLFEALRASRRGAALPTPMGQTTALLKGFSVTLTPLVGR